jgi:co-chaperonin GroES (HSP10)
VIRPLHDWLLVEVEPEKAVYHFTSIVRVSKDPVSMGRVLAVGPGRYYIDKYVPTTVKAGDRVAFLTALTETGEGRSIGHVIMEDQALIRESDVLMVVEAGVEVTK